MVKRFDVVKRKSSNIVGVITSVNDEVWLDIVWLSGHTSQYTHVSTVEPTGRRIIAYTTADKAGKYPLEYLVGCSDDET